MGRAHGKRLHAVGIDRVDVGVEDSGQHVTAARVDDGGRQLGRRIANDGLDLAVRDAQIGVDDIRRVHQRSTLDQQVIRGHGDGPHGRLIGP